MGTISLTSLTIYRSKDYLCFLTRAKNNKTQRYERLLNKFTKTFFRDVSNNASVTHSK